MKRSTDRDESTRELAELRAELSNAARDLRAAQDSLTAKSNQASMDMEACKEVATLRSEVRAAC